MSPRRFPLLLLLFLAVLSASPVWACFAVVAGREATADGSVLLGHNEVNDGLRLLNFRRIPRMRHGEGATVRLRRGGELPQVRETWSFLWSENPGLEFSDAYLNEWGVAIVSDGCRTREDDYDTLVARGELRDGGIGYMLRRMVAQRARSAREGVELAGSLVESVGYADSGRTYIIADPREAWLFAAVRGRRWVARRVPDDCVALVPNVHIITEVDLNDTGSFLASPDLVDYAVHRGWFDPAAGEPFNFRRVYRADREDPADPRQWRGQALVTGKDLPWPPSEPLPFAVKPAQKLTLEMVAQLLRDVQSPVPICNTDIQEASIFQLRPERPLGVGCVYWRTTAEPRSSVFTPWYLGITHTPEFYHRPVDIKTQLTLYHHFEPPEGTFQVELSSAWWIFKTLQDTVHAGPAARLEWVRSVWADFERQLFREQEKLDRKALMLWETGEENARVLLTQYSHGKAEKACSVAQNLTEAVKRMNGDSD